MSVGEEFLRDGVAHSDVSMLGKLLGVHHLKWALVLWLPRQWSRDKLSNTLYAPVFQMLFGTNNEKANDADITTMGAETWQLLFYDVKQSCSDVLWGTKGAELISDIFAKVPVGLHPSSFSIVCVTHGCTHERLNIFSERAFALFEFRVRQVLESLRPLCFSIRWDRDCNGLPAFLVSAVQWSLKQTPEASDVSAPPQLGNDALLETLSCLNPLLYTTAFQEFDEVPPTVTPNSALEEQRCGAVALLKRRVGHVTSFCVDGAGAFRYVLLVQRPFVEKKEVSFENLDPGPLTPQPIGAELHLMQDAGEVLHLQRQLCDEKSFASAYEDMMHEDGEILVQLTPVEGIAFDDIDRLIKAQYGDRITPDELHLPAAICEGSCCGLTFPRVVLRRPTGTVAKDTPIAAPHGQLLLEPPSQQAHWEAARAALIFLSEHITPLPKPQRATEAVTETQGAYGGGWHAGYTLAKEIAPVPKPNHSDECAWCGRRREKLLRCGGCRVEMYCCKTHQMKDWKDGGHKKSCGLWRRAKEEYESAVAPLLEGPAAAAAKLPATPSASTMVTLLQFLSESHLKPSVAGEALVVHIIGINRDVHAFIKELAQRVNTVATLVAQEGGGDSSWGQLRLLLSSDAFGEDERNAVYAVTRGDGGGVIERTMPTTVMGDSWHLAAPGAREAIVLVRLYDAKYHIVAQEVINSTRTVESSSVAPAAVLSVGDPMMTGMTYFSAASAVLADNFLGVIPVMCTEPTLVSAHGTLEAIVARLKSSTQILPKLKAKVLSRCASDDLIRLNKDGLCTEPFLATDSDTAEMKVKQVALKSHYNLYYFYIPVESCGR